MKYHIGDQVCVRRDLEAGKRYDNSRESGSASDTATQDMVKMGGQVVTIRSIHGNKYKVTGDPYNYNWVDRMFEDVDVELEEIDEADFALLLM